MQAGLCENKYTLHTCACVWEKEIFFNHTVNIPKTFTKVTQSLRFEMNAKKKRLGEQFIERLIKRFQHYQLIIGREIVASDWS